ncbi:MAG: TIGR03619 family F420-dependent LLM class oxidoreductase [Chloroflexota bacterium]|nr:TIGR03619 family F420-dependent LLM class oxidoreductase [Chloroflexota bacterium]MDE3193661.1 TIGR03619 family F420-dependent LLM class oxidoreductase [Chloroflexota bacterium]
MRFGIEIPTCRELSPYPLGFAQPDAFRSIALAAEDLGYYSLWGNDHLVTTPDEVAGADGAPSYYEPFVTYGFLAALTSRIKLVTAIIPTPLRQPVLLAKQVSTLDRLSGGRVVLGLGIGSKRLEFEALATDPKASRGKMHDEFIEAIRILLDEHEGSFEGRYFRFAQVAMKPAAIQQPFPLYLTGTVPDALERVGAVAQGWIVSATMSDDDIRDRIQVLRAAAARAGRDPARIEVCLLQNVAIDETEEGAKAVHEDLRRLRLPRQPQPHARPPEAAPTVALPPGRVSGGVVGTPAQVISCLETYRSIGIDHVGMVIEARTVADLLERARLFAREVMPKLS